MIKLLELITGLGQGGAEQVVLDIATHLDRSQFDVSVCSILDTSGDQGVYAKRLEDAGIKVHTLGVQNKLQINRAVQLLELLRREKPDILHCHMFHANVLGRRLGKKAGIKNIISTVHIVERRWRPWRFWAERSSDPNCKITVCVSNAVMEFQSKKTRLPRERFIVIPNGIDTARFARSIRTREEVLAELNVKRGSKVIGSIGRLFPQKNFDTLVRALANIPGAELVIAGEGPERDRLEWLAKRLGCADRLHLPGRREDVPDLLHAFDVFAMSSKFEGLPLSLIEAMAAGVPVVAAAIDSIPEVIGAEEFDGPYGTLVPGPDDVETFTAALAAPPNTTLAARAQERALSHYDVKVMVQRYEGLFHTVMHSLQ